MNLQRIGLAAAVGGGGRQSGPVSRRPNPTTAKDSRSPATLWSKASQAALAFTGGGTVTGTEVGDEESLYEVEVTLADGSQTDVQLDETSWWSAARQTGPAPTSNPTPPATEAWKMTIGRVRGLVPLCSARVVALSVACGNDSAPVSAGTWARGTV